jgi:hypothetical protein
MALPIEALNNDQRMQERGEKRGAVERLRTEDSSQAFLKDLLLMTVEIREGVEDALLADRAALANDQPEVLRQVAFIFKIFNFAKRTKKSKVRIIFVTFYPYHLTILV